MYFDQECSAQKFKLKVLRNPRPFKPLLQHTKRHSPPLLSSGFISLCMFSLISLSLISLSFASPFSLTGQVTNKKGEVISGATVRVKGPSNATTQTNQKGIYSLTSLKKGRYTLTVVAKRYIRYRKTIQINKTKRLNITLTPKPSLKTKSSKPKPKSLLKESGSGSNIGAVMGSDGIGGLGMGRMSIGSGGMGSAGMGSGRSIKKRRKTSLSVLHGSVRSSGPIGSQLNSPPPHTLKMNRDSYQHRDENPYKNTKVNPLSTFSIDVDTASYANLRRFIFDGQYPPKGAIRLEEMINYFDYDYLSPSTDDLHPFKVYTELAPSPWNPQSRLFHIGVQGRRIDRSKLPPSNLVFLIDVSGSMDGKDRLPLLKQAFILLASTLRPQDHVSIVVYAGAAGLVLPPTSGDQRQKIIKAFSQLKAGGSTSGGAGIKLAYKIAKDHFIKGGNNRVILATDGDFNVGVSSQSGLVSLIEKQRKTGVFLTVLGFGRGNYQDSKMSMLAKKGNGNHAYIDSLLEAQKVLVSEMGGTLFTIAKDVKIQLEFNPSKIMEYRLIGYESRVLATKDFNDDKKDAGELGAGHSVTAVYELIPTPKDQTKRGDKGEEDQGENTGVDALKYQKKEVIPSDEWLTIKLRYKKPDGTKSVLLSQTHKEEIKSWSNTSQNFRFSAGVIAFGMQLQDSKYKGKIDWPLIEKLISEARGEDSQGYRAELLEMIKKAKRLNKKDRAVPHDALGGGYRGYLSKNQIRRVLRRRQRSLKKCYDDALKVNPKLAGKVLMSWVINTDGRTSNVKMLSSQIKHPRFKRCMIHRLKKLKFPPPTGGSVTIKYPFIFQRG